MLAKLFNNILHYLIRVAQFCIHIIITLSIQIITAHKGIVIVINVLITLQAYRIIAHNSTTEKPTKSLHMIAHHG